MAMSNPYVQWGGHAQMEITVKETGHRVVFPVGSVEIVQDQFGDLEATFDPDQKFQVPAAAIGMTVRAEANLDIIDQLLQNRPSSLAPNSISPSFDVVPITDRQVRQAEEETEGPELCYQEAQVGKARWVYAYDQHNHNDQCGKYTK